MALIGAFPLFGASLQKPFREYLEAQRAKLQHRAGGRRAEEATPIVLEDGDQHGLLHNKLMASNKRRAKLNQGTDINPKSNSFLILTRATARIIGLFFSVFFEISFVTWLSVNIFTF